MAEPKELKAGDPCPTCGGELRLDPRHDPETVIDRATRNAQNPGATQRFAAALREKTAEHGRIHTCAGCGYQARLHVKAAKGKAA